MVKEAQSEAANFMKEVEKAKDDAFGKNALLALKKSLKKVELELGKVSPIDKKIGL